MNCLRCGRETAEGQVFCPDCLAEMEKYPVKPGTAVLLPSQSGNAAPRRAPKRRAPTAEEQLKTLKRRTRLLTALLAVALAAVIGLGVVLQQQSASRLRRGQNYTSIVSTTADAEESTP